MRSSTLAFFFGVLVCQTFSSIPEIPWVVLFIFPLIFLIWKLPHYRLVFMLALGLVWTIWHISTILSQKLPFVLEGKDITITGVIIGLPKQKLSKSNVSHWQFKFAPKPFQEWPNPGHLRLNWYDDPLQPLRPGQQWRLTVRLKRARGMLNPGGFDYERWLFQHHIRATGYIRSKGEQRLLGEPSLFNIDNLRYHLAKTIKQELDNQPNTGIIIALALGEKQWISPEHKEVLQHTGTAHLVAISGLHVGFIAWLVFWIGNWLWRHAGKATLWVPSPRFAAGLSGLAAFFYALLAGFSLPTQRALIMVTVALSGIVFARNVAVSHILTLALLLVLLWEPLAVLSVGFWLSFGAVAIIVYAVSCRRTQGLSALAKKGFGTGMAQWAVTLGLFPIVLAVFGYIPLTSLPANAIAIPWVSFVVMPLTLLGTAMILPLPTLGGELLHIATYIIDILFVSLEWFASFEWSLWLHYTPPLWTVITAMVGVAILLLPRGFPARWLGIVWLLPLFFIPPAYPQRGEVWFTLLDVGQGLAAVIRTENYVLVYDTGPKSRSGFDTGSAVVIPFLRAKGIQQIDRLLISHGDNDHSGGARSILETLTVSEVLTSATEKFKGDNVLSCQAGQHWHWDNVNFQILYPPANFIVSKKNNRSCVLKVTTASGISILLPGDIEKRAEYNLLRRYRTDLKADILIAPHHGSKTSSTENFIDAVQPTIALFPVGYRNRFGHPNKEIMQRYRRRKIHTWDTAKAGAIQFRLSDDGISEFWLAREEMRRYWHD